MVANSEVGKLHTHVTLSLYDINLCAKRSSSLVNLREGSSNLSIQTTTYAE
jgi:hypothetical protein